MRNNYLIWLQCIAVVAIAAVFAGCPSSKRIVVEGYNDAALNRKRVMLVVPAGADVKMDNAAAFGAARGSNATGAQDQVGSELRTKLTYELAQRLDSNTVLNYADQAIAGSYPLNATTDLNGGQPKSWDAFKRAAHEGNIDFFIVVNNISFSDAASANGGRGKEGVDADYALLDPQQGKVVTSGHISLDQEELALPGDTYARLASALAAKMPFFVGESKLK
jgi:hypothetical protein